MAGDDWLGAELAGYRIDALIGRGATGVVYRATHLRLHRPAALKLLAAGLAADVEYRHRFERETRLAASLDHLPIPSNRGDLVCSDVERVVGLVVPASWVGRLDLPAFSGPGVAEARGSRARRRCVACSAMRSTLEA
jgi:serine/threonine protein kinase